MLISNTQNPKVISKSPVSHTRFAESPVSISIKPSLQTRFQGNPKDGLLPKVPDLVEPLSTKQRLKTTGILALGAGVLLGALGLWCTPLGLALSAGGALAASAIVLVAPAKYVVDWHNKVIVSAQNKTIDFKNRARVKAE
jgi:hypothetical protein